MSSQLSQNQLALMDDNSATPRPTSNYQNQMSEMNQSGINDSMMMDNNGAYNYDPMNDDSFTGNNNSSGDTEADFIKVEHFKRRTYLTLIICLDAASRSVGTRSFAAAWLRRTWPVENEQTGTAACRTVDDRAAEQFAARIGIHH